MIILNQGVRQWNQWRSDYPVAEIDFSEIDLSGLNLSGANLKKAILSKAILNGTDLSDAELGGADLVEAKLSGANLERANLAWADLSEADLYKANLAYANLDGVQLRGANLSAANLYLAISRGANFSDSYLMGADLYKANFQGAIFKRANLRDANLRYVDLHKAMIEEADFSRANLYKANLYNMNLGRAIFYGANLNGAFLRKSDFKKADLRKAYLISADLGEVNLTEADLGEAKLIGASLYKANLEGANLRKAFLRQSNLTHANLYRANISDANLIDALLCNADLSRANLGGARCDNSDFSNANLSEARLIGTHLNGITLTGACLWETQRAGWSIDKVICESIYWDKEREKAVIFGSNDFERLYAEKYKVKLFYPDGIRKEEIVTLDALIQHLQNSYLDCKLRLESIADAPGGAIVTLTIDNADTLSPGQIESVRASIQEEAEQKAHYLRQCLEDERQVVAQLKGEVNALERMFDKFLLNQKPNFLLITGGVEMSDTYNVEQAGAVGPNAHAHDMTFNQIGGQIERSMELSQLADELARLRQALKKEATEPEHDKTIGKIAEAEEAARAKDSSKVAEFLKPTGKWALDFASKIGASLAAEAIKQSMGIK